MVSSRRMPQRSRNVAAAVIATTTSSLRSFSVAIGTGIVALVISFFALAAARQVGGWPQYFPWVLPMMLFAEQPHSIETGLVISGALGLVVATAGCLDFCRREVQ